MKVAKTLVSALFASLFVAAMTFGQAVAQQQQQQRPNIVVIWGDDIGQSNVSAYSRGMMGYQTPNIDRLAGEGMMFTDYYAEQSCTAGRASFLTGQSGLRTGMTKGLARRNAGSTERRSDDCRVIKTTRLYDRPVRQEPSRRPQ